MPVVWSDRCRLHEPGGEIWVGVRTPGTESAARADAILAALLEEEPRIMPAEQHSDTALLAVHDPALLAFLESAWDEWTAAGLDREPGQDRVVPYVFAHAELTAAAFADRLGGPVAVLDIDARHGNGTQEIFYDRTDVLVRSVHVDPGAGWFPHFLGFADETGGGANKNLPIAPGSGDDAWLDAVAGLAAWAKGAAATSLVVPPGVDAAAGDPESPLDVTATGFRQAGRMLGALELPTVLVQEGGYDLAAHGPLVREVLLGLEEGAA